MKSENVYVISGFSIVLILVVLGSFFLINSEKEKSEKLGTLITSKDYEIAEVNKKLLELSSSQEEIDRLNNEKSELENSLRDLNKEKEQVTRDLSQKIKKLEDEIANLDTQSKKIIDDSRRNQEIKNKLIDELEEEIKSGKIEISKLSKNNSIRLEEKILFDSGKTVIKKSSMEILRKIGRILQGISDKHIQVEGHTDSRPIGKNLKWKFPTNWELSSARATSVIRFLIDDAKLEPTRVSGAGFGEFQQVIDEGDPPTYHPENRRVEIVLLPLRK